VVKVSVVKVSVVKVSVVKVSVVKVSVRENVSLMFHDDIFCSCCLQGMLVPFM